MRTMRLIAAFLTALLAALVAPAMAQEQDLPGRVGRIAHIEGAVSVYQDSETGWEKGYINSPFTSENSVWTDLESRSELRVAGTAIRLDETTQIDIVRLDDNEFEAFVPRGTVSVRVRHFERTDSWQFDTPYARFSLRANGRYRIDVDPDRQEARVTTFVGEAQVGSESGRVLARPGDTVRVFGGDSPSYVVERALSDPFDKWAQSRDSAWVETNTVQYVSPQMTGYEDLDRNGTWAQEPDYGPLWYPTTVAAGWAPYRYGHWGYTRPWGYTWIDDSSWGYAPFHYGRWVYVRNRWGWHPGTRAPRPVWAPALVAWVGGAGVSIGVSGPTVGWYPLSPWDRYQPWYRASTTYVNRVNVVVINNPPRGDRAQWRDYSREHGVTVVNRNVMVDRSPVQRAAVIVKPEFARTVQPASAAAVLPPRQEVMERHAASVRLAAARPVEGSQRPALAPAAPKPEFKVRPAVATQTPQPARAAPPPAARVTPPPAARTAPPPATREAPPATGRPLAPPAARETAPPPGRPATPPTTREAPPLTTREAPPPTARPLPPPATREAPPTTTREAPPPAARPPAAREAPPPTTREAPPPTARPLPPPATREAPPPTPREAPPPAARPPATREAPPAAPNREAQQKAEEQKAAQAAQERARQQQQQRTRAEEQKAAQAAKQQQQQRAEEQKAAQERTRQQQQQQQQARQPQPAEKPAPARQPLPPAEKPAPARKEPTEKEKKEKEEEDKKKSGR